MHAYTYHTPYMVARCLTQRDSLLLTHSTKSRKHCNSCAIAQMLLKLKQSSLGTSHHCCPIKINLCIDFRLAIFSIVLNTDPYEYEFEINEKTFNLLTIELEIHTHTRKQIITETGRAKMNRVPMPILKQYTHWDKERHTHTERDTSQCCA